MSGPFFCYLHAPAFGELAQKFGAFCRYKTGVPPRLSEFAILVTAQHWKAAYEWAAHEPQALRAGVKQKTIDSLSKGRLPKGAPKDELALYAFIKELYRDRSVSNATYKSVNKILGDSATVELVGLLGYYAMVAMTLNVFRMPVPASKPVAGGEIRLTSSMGGRRAARHGRHRACGPDRFRRRIRHQACQPSETSACP